MIEKNIIQPEAQNYPPVKPEIQNIQIASNLSRNETSTLSSSFASIKSKTMDYARKAIFVEEPDRELWKLVTTFPNSPLFIKYLMLILNIFFPGVGTMIYAIAGFRPFSKTQFIIGLMQFASSRVIIGYFWSVLWGVLFFNERPMPTEIETQHNINAPLVQSVLVNQPEKIMERRPMNFEVIPEESHAI